MKLHCTRINNREDRYRGRRKLTFMVIMYLIPFFLCLIRYSRAFIYFIIFFLLPSSSLVGKKNAPWKTKTIGVVHRMELKVNRFYRRHRRIKMTLSQHWADTFFHSFFSDFYLPRENYRREENQMNMKREKMWIKKKKTRQNVESHKEFKGK